MSRGKALPCLQLVLSYPCIPIVIPVIIRYTSYGGTVMYLAYTFSTSYSGVAIITTITATRSHCRNEESNDWYERRKYRHGK